MGAKPVFVAGAILAAATVAAPAGAEFKLPQIGDAAGQGQTFLPDGEGDDAGPRQAVTDYLAAMTAGNGDPDLAVYSAATQAAARNWRMSAGQMRNVARTYAHCSDAEIFIQGGLAVQRYPAEQRLCAPFFLSREGETWVLDLTVMGDTILFNTADEWHFNVNTPIPHAFAFRDWRLDENGFPFD